MPITRKIKNLFLTIFILLFLMTTAAAAQVREERAKLLEQQKALDSKIAALKREQDFLIFEKILFDSDSKYLIIRLSEKTGQLKYKNRVLKDFHFSSSNAGKIKQGMAKLSEKKGSSSRLKSLVFENSVIIEAKRESRGQVADVPRLFMRNKVFRALFHALEEGAPAYFLP